MFKTFFKLFSGIPGWTDYVVRAELQDDRIEFFRSLTGKSNGISLRYNQIIDTQFCTVKTIEEVSKSMLGRAAVGSLFGPAGAFVGALSGIGKKKRANYQRFYLISYVNEDEESDLLILDTDCMACYPEDFERHLREFIPKTV